MGVPESEAVQAIGGGSQADDWHMDPKKHAERMTDKAESLKDILENSAVQTIIQQYEEANQEAKLAQESYKKLGKREIYAAGLASIIGGVVLFLGVTEENWQTVLRIGLLCIQAVLLALVVSTKYRLQQSKVYRVWQQERSKAETARIELFEHACDLNEDQQPPASNSASPSLLELQLAYFIRYQLMVQMFFYKERGKQHQSAVSVYLNKSAILTFFIALVASISSVFGADIADSIALLAFVGLIMPILLSMQTSLSMLNQDQRNAERYKLTYAQLLELCKQIDHVRTAAKQNDRPTVVRFINAVNDLISVEHKQWQYDLSTSNEQILNDT